MTCSLFMLARQIRFVTCAGAYSVALSVALVASVALAQEEADLGHAIAVTDPSGNALQDFQEALADATEGRGQARVVIYGASHTSSDQYTGYLRRLLQDRFGESGAGFVMPVRPFTYYNHRAARIESGGRWRTLRVRGQERAPDAYGLMGFAVETGGEAWARVSPRRERGRHSRASRFDVYYYQQPGGGTFDLLLDGTRVQTVNTDHATNAQGYASVTADDQYHSLTIRTRGDGKVRLFGVSMERQAPGVVLDHFGVPGARVRDQLPWNEEVQREHLRRRNPDLVVLAYGTNESGYERVPMSTYEANLRTVVARIQAATPNASCLLIGPSEWPTEVDGEWHSRATTERINDVQEQVAASEGCGFFDLTRFVGGAEEMHRWVTNDPPYALRDHIHYTELGHQRLANVLFHALVP